MLFFLNFVLSQTQLISSFLWKRHYFRLSLYGGGLLRDVFQLGLKSFWSDKHLYSYMESLFRASSKDKDGRVGVLSFLPFEKRFYSRDIWLLHFKKVPFENLLAPVSVYYDEILSTHYGDYMVPVKAPSCHGSLIEDTKNDYKFYLSKLKKSLIISIISFFRRLIFSLFKRLKS